MHVHICPIRMRLVVAANAAISVHASCVASSVGTGTVWKWSYTQSDSHGPASAASARSFITGHWSAGLDVDEVVAPALRDKESESHAFKPRYARGRVRTSGYSFAVAPPSMSESRTFLSQLMTTLAPWSSNWCRSSRGV